MNKLKAFLCGSVLLAAGAMAVRPAAAAETVEVLHWWTSGGEAAALAVLKKKLESQGVTWQDVPIAGGGGEQAMTVLRARVTGGNPPTASQMLGFDIQDWAAQGVLANLNDIAAKEGWDKTIPPSLQAFSKYKGTWVAAPVNIHSTNWIWVNKKIFDDLGLKLPQSWDEFIADLDKVKAAGKVALAHGGQPWQEATIFDSVVLTTGGPTFYKKALIDLDPAIYQSPTCQRDGDSLRKQCPI